MIFNVNLNLNGDILNENIANKLNHESIFRDMLLDTSNDLLISNFSISVLGKPTSNSSGRPIYRISKYRTVITGTTQELNQRLEESTDLGSKPGAMALHTSNNKLYIALPNQGRIVKIDYSNNTLGSVSEFFNGLPKPVKDLAFDSKGTYLYVTAGDNTVMFRFTLNAEGNSDVFNGNFVSNMGTGNARMALDSAGNIFTTIGTGVDWIDPNGKRSNVLFSFEGERPMIDLVFDKISETSQNLYLNQLNSTFLFKVTP